ncbi:MAG: hypothetical protein KAV18_03405 [Candidatus Omnitrophica bacterium]|nr:hypothetical protein [Candidatus Omnitrophota bacterium]
MPNTKEHLQQAKHNQETIDFLLTDIDRFADWITAIAFYTALHLVEAVFFIDPKINHGLDHIQRREVLRTTKKYEKIYDHYRPLWNASLMARYLSDSQSSTTGRIFNDCYSSQIVNDIMLNHHLAQIEKSVTRFLSPPAPSKKKTKKKQ